MLEAGADRGVPVVPRRAGRAHAGATWPTMQATFASPRASVMTVHLCSTVPLGEDARRRPPTASGCVRGTSNVCVNDASLLPDAPGRQPAGVGDGVRHPQRPPLRRDDQAGPLMADASSHPTSRSSPAPPAGSAGPCSTTCSRDGAARPRRARSAPSSPTTPTEAALPTSTRRRRRRRRRPPARRSSPSCSPALAGTVDVIHTAGVIHPRTRRRLRRGQRPRHRQRRRAPRWPPACGGSCTCRRTARSAPTRTAGDAFRNDEPYHPYYGYGRSKMQAELRVLDAVGRGLDAVIVRPPWFYGPFQPPRQTTFFRMVRTGTLPGDRRRPPAALDGLRRQPRAGRRARRADARRRPGAAWWIADAAAVRGQRDRRDRRAGARAPRASSVTPNRDAAAGDRRARRRARRRASSSAPAATCSSCTCSARWTRRSPATSPSPAPSSATTPTVGAGRGHAPQHPLVRRPGPRAVTRPASSPAAAATSVAARRRASSPAATTCGCSTSTSPAPTTVGVDVDRRPTSATRRGAARPSTASTSCTTTSPRCRWPSDPALLRSVNVDGTPIAARRVPATPASARSCTRRRARCSACRSRTRCCRPRCPTPPEAYGHAKLAAEWACLRAAADGLDVTIVRPRTILGHGRLGHLRDPVRLDRRRRRPVRARRRLATATSSSTPTTSPTCACSPPAQRRPGDLQRRHRPLRHDARGARARCAPTPAPAPACARCRPGRRRWRCGPAPALAPHAVRAVPLADVRPVDVVRHRPRHASALGWQPRWSNDEMFAQSYDWFLAHRDARRRPAPRTTAGGPPAGALGAAQARRPACAAASAADARRRHVGRRRHRRGRRPGPARLRAGAAVVARDRMPADTKLYLYLDPGRLISDAPVDVRRPPVRRLGAAPGHRLPVAAGPVVLARRRRRPPRLGGPPAVDRHACSSPPAPACCGWPAGSGSA